jgi:uncharacterized membrane protein YgcG
VLEGIAFFKPMFDEISSALSAAFGEDKASSVSTFKEIFTILTVALGGALTAVGALIGAVIGIQLAIYGAFIKVGEFIGMAIMFGDTMYEAGKAIVSGLIKGISDMTGELWAKVTGIADGIKAKFKEALKISSPSKVFEQYGKFTGQGFESGLEKSAPDSGGVAEAMIPKGAGSAGGGSSAGGGGGGGLTLHLHLGQVSGTPEEVMRAARREFEMALSALKISRGVD